MEQFHYDRFIPPEMVLPCLQIKQVSDEIFQYSSIQKVLDLVYIFKM